MSYITAENPECVLYGKATTGKIKFWKAAAIKKWARETEEGVQYFEEQPDDLEGVDEVGVVLLTHGYKDGESHIDNAYPIRVGKNLGKSNETTPYEQAIFEANSRVKKKLDQNYRLTEEELDSLPVGPMLAHPFEKRKSSLEYPCLLQPKLNGVRCLAHKVSKDKVELRSRMGKLYETMPHIEEQLLPALEVGEIWDGEIYVHGWSFQRIVSAVKAVNEDTPNLQYHVYDMVSEISPFYMRSLHVAAGINSHIMIPQGGKTEDPLAVTPLIPGCVPGETKPRYVFHVHCINCNSEADAHRYCQEHIEDGYEGVILRNEYSLYAIGQRSADLLKLKYMQDAEYPIVAQAPDKLGEVVFRCITPKGTMFKVKPKGTHEERVAMVDTDHRDKLLTVQYQELSEDGVPIFPVGLSVRDYE